MHRTVFCLGLATLLPIAAAWAGDPPGPVPAPVPHPERAPVDAALLTRIAGVLPPGDRPASDVLKALSASDTREDRDVGYGARRWGLALYGSATTAWVTVVAREGRVIALDASVPADAKAGATILAAVKGAGREVAGIEVRPDGGASWREGKRMLAWTEAVTAALGGPRPVVELPAPVREAVAALRDPLASLRYGVGCGDGGDPPPGRDALEALVKARSLDGLRLALASPNPEGRVFAAEGLLRLAAAGTVLSKEDRAALEAVRAAPAKIEACSGCEHLTSTARELLAEALAGR